MHRIGRKRRRANDVGLRARKRRLLCRVRRRAHYRCGGCSAITPHRSPIRATADARTPSGGPPVRHGHPLGCAAPQIKGQNLCRRETKQQTKQNTRSIHNEVLRYCRHPPRRRPGCPWPVRRPGRSLRLSHPLWQHQRCRRQVLDRQGNLFLLPLVRRCRLRDRLPRQCHRLRWRRQHSGPEHGRSRRPAGLHRPRRLPVLHPGALCLHSRGLRHHRLHSVVELWPGLPRLDQRLHCLRFPQRHLPLPDLRRWL